MKQELIIAVRTLTARPAFFVLVVLTLAIGIGANTAIFSVFNAVLLRPLPYVDEERYVTIETRYKDAPAGEVSSISPADSWDWRDQTPEAFEQLAFYSGGGFTLTGVSIPETFPAARVSPNFFLTTSVRPLLGRVFKDEDAVVSAPDTIILGHAVWQENFGGDPNIVGKTLGDTNTTVIGVLPPDFKYPAWAQVWIPLSRDSGEMFNRANRYFQGIGLVKRGFTVGQAESSLQVVASRLAEQYPETNRNILVRLTPFRDRMVGNVKTALWILLGVVGFLLLIACANVANLMLARGVSRQKEMAIRLAIGASKLNLIRQLLIESFVLSILSGVAGLCVSFFAVDWLVALLPENYTYKQVLDAVKVDPTVMLFTLAAAIVTGFLFGLFPAWQASRTSVNENLKEGSHSTESRRQLSFRKALIAAEAMLAVIVLIGAGLLIGSFMRLQRSALGFDPNHLLASTIELPFQEGDNQTRARFIQSMLERVKSAPGVSAVATSTGGPFPFLTFSFTIDGRDMRIPGDALYDVISDNYFQVMKAKISAGRAFNASDKKGSDQVLIINQALARLYFPNENPLGKRITIRFPHPETWQIVGVVQDMNQGEPGRVLPQMFVHYQQRPWLSASLIVRAENDVSGMSQTIQRMIWSVDPRQPLSKLDTPLEALNKSIAEPRLYAALLAIFALIALVLSAIGIYGVVAHTVANRIHEIGILLALGARPADVLIKMINQGMLPTAIGISVGLIASSVLTKFLTSFLFGISPTEPRIFLAISALLGVVAFIACFLPAWSAAKVDPLSALRYE